MYCPRCGTRNEPGDRFCSSCGAQLGKEKSEGPKPSPRERLGALIGTSRRARWTTAATALAIVVAIVAFVALDSDEEIPRDRYTLAAEKICLDSKREIAANQALVRTQGDRPSASDFARGLLPAVSAWRQRLAALEVPPDREAEAARLEEALRDVEVRIARLARIARDGKPSQISRSAARADEASTAVEEAVAELGLDECASVRLGFVPDEG